MLRQVLYLFAFLGMITKDAEAHPKRGQPLFRILVQDVDLTANQKIAFFDMQQKTLEIGDDFHQHLRGLELLAAYAKGDLSAKEWHQQIDVRATDSIEKISLHFEGLTDILMTYTQDQKEQVRENFLSHQIKPKNIRKNKRRGKRMRSLLQAMKPSKSQRELINELKIHKKDEKAAGKDSRKAKKERFLSLLDGTASINSIQRSMRVEHNERVELHHDKADIWIEIIDSLDMVQRQTLIESLSTPSPKPHHP